MSTEEQRSLQKTFHTFIATEERPCAVKRRADKLSDVKDCSLFRLKPGMSVDEVNQILDGSGYFPSKPATMETCNPAKTQCIHTHYIFRQRDGFSVTASFAPRGAEDSSLALKQIVLWFDSGSNPYFDPETIRAAFKKIIGPPDESIETTDNWGGYSSFRIQAHTNSHRRYHIELTGASKSTTPER